MTTDLAVGLADSVQNIHHMDDTEFGYNGDDDVGRAVRPPGRGRGCSSRFCFDSSNVNTNRSNVMVAAWYGAEEVRASRGVREERSHQRHGPPHTAGACNPL